MHRASLALALLLTAAAGGRAQPAATPSLPAGWLGAWEGSCTTGPPGGGGQAFGMVLEVGPYDAGEGGWAWRTTYSMPGRPPQVRDYLLEPTADDHRYVVDERNGIRLDAARHGDVLYEHFALPGHGRSLHVRWEFAGDALRVEMPTYGLRPARSSEGPGATAVTSFPLLVVQDCELSRRDAP